MKHTTITAWLFLAGCATNGDHTQTVASEINTDPGATTWSFHSPSGVDLEIRSVTPMGNVDPIYMKYDGIEGEAGQSGGPAAFFFGDVVRSANTPPRPTSATLGPLAAVLLGLATTEDFTFTTGFTLDPTQFQPLAAPIDRRTAVTLIQQAAAYAFLKDGAGAGELANSFIATLGIDPCP